ncbi:hypothetical protein K435DRAFT_871561 [Dendrothele bispora CBS 962.96]|uniref:GST N-terminal domain-containing protein n=1 Tax=Dendrothele bispora (strain CBS 962.96) TaxID=1314807 RepID=A0A4S8L3S8_DENBC|nr:hypothetical protein K435DRAFT_871561 [Dendrothele bispora CBS 962.96]
MSLVYPASKDRVFLTEEWVTALKTNNVITTTSAMLFVTLSIIKASPDIEKTLKDLGIAAYTTHPDCKTPLYTLPAIYDPTTKTGLTESFAIAKYLDEKYPDKLMLVPKGTEVLQKVHVNSMRARLSPIWQRTKEEMEGQTMEEMYPKEEKRKEEWKKLGEGFGQVNKWYGREDVLVMGGEEKACFADFAFAIGYVIWIRILFGKESEEWEDVSGWQDGR